MNVMTAYKEMIAGRLSEAEFLRIKAEAFSDGGTRKTCPRCGNIMFVVKDRFGRFERWQCGLQSFRLWRETTVDVESFRATD